MEDKKNERRRDGISLTSPRIIAEIVGKLREIHKKGRSFYAFPLNRTYESYMEHEANTHSAKIEIEEEKEVLKTESLFDRSIQTDKLVKNLEGAYSWGWNELGRRLAEEERLPFDIGFVRALAFKVEPKNFLLNKEYETDSDSGENLANFRRPMYSVRVTNSTFGRPSPEKVPGEIGGYMDELNRRIGLRRVGDTIETACYAHFHLLRIHPFSDGNGRTARAMQNVILKVRGLPPPLIYAGERHDYYEHIENALHGWRARTGNAKVGSPEESHLYNYLAGKISATLDRMLDYSVIYKRHRKKNR